MRDTSEDDARRVRMDDHREENFVSVSAPASPFAVRRSGPGAFLGASSDSPSILLGHKDGGRGVGEDGPKVAALPALGYLSAAGPRRQSRCQSTSTDPLRYMRRP